MAEKCATNECLRVVSVAGGTCAKCEKGLPPMTNPKSPHAIGKSGTGTKYTDPVRPVSKEPINPSISEIAPLSPANKTPSKAQVISVSEATAKDAVKLIFNTYWYGWNGGTPTGFESIFEKYGRFIPDRTVASKMVGAPDKHKSTINMKANPTFSLAYEIFSNEGERAYMEFLSNNLTAEDLLTVGRTNPIMNDGDRINLPFNQDKEFVFTKVGDGEFYTYEDKRNKNRTLPRWAIA